MKIKNQHNNPIKKISSLYSQAKTILIALLSFGFGVALVLSDIPGYIKANFALLQNQETLLSFIEKNDLQSLNIDLYSPQEKQLTHEQRIQFWVQEAREKLYQPSFGYRDETKVFDQDYMIENISVVYLQIILAAARLQKLLEEI